MSRSVFHDELGRRAETIIDRADWDDYVTDNMTIGHLKVRQVGLAIDIVDLSDGKIVYSGNSQTGRITIWMIDRIQSTLDTLRKHMLLQDLADV